MVTTRHVLVLHHPQERGHDPCLLSVLFPLLFAHSPIINRATSRSNQRHCRQQKEERETNNEGVGCAAADDRQKIILQAGTSVLGFKVDMPHLSPNGFFGCLKFELPMVSKWWLLWRPLHFPLSEHRTRGECICLACAQNSMRRLWKRK